VPLLERRIELLAAAPLHLPRLAKLPTQVGHGDSSVLNFLFTDEGAVAGVVDFGPPEPYFRDFELSRIAFDPETLASCDNWREIAQSALAAYLEVFPAARVPSLALGPALWLCHLLRSDLGVKQHLLDPHPTQQARLDRYWECRCAAAEILLRELAPLEAEIADLVRAG
jgi:Ser/Thr protein kinase RdoA (MazF antagonist)